MYPQSWRIDNSLLLCIRVKLAGLSAHFLLERRSQSDSGPQLGVLETYGNKPYAQQLCSPSCGIRKTVCMEQHAAVLIKLQQSRS